MHKHTYLSPGQHRLTEHKCMLKKCLHDNGCAYILCAMVIWSVSVYISEVVSWPHSEAK